MVDEQIKESLRNLDAACLCDASSEVLPFPPEFRPVCEGVKMIGRAFPVNALDDFFPVICALKDAGEDDILVIKGSTVHAFAGELFTLESRNRKLGGIVIEGSVRDTNLIRKIDFPVYSTSVCPRACSSVKYREPVRSIKIGEITVTRGDLLFGDNDGIIRIPEESLQDIIQKAREIQKKEEKIIEKLNQGKSFFEYLNYEEHLGKVKSSLDSKLSFRI